MTIPNNNAAWIEETRVKTHETDFRNLWKPACFFQAMQEAASRNALSMDFGYDRLVEHGLAWVLSRMKVRFYRFPSMGEQVQVCTWPKCIYQKIMFLRDFQILDAQGEKLAEATSVWLLLDIQERRLLPMNRLPMSIPENSTIHAIEAVPGKLEMPEELSECFALDARYSHLDVMNHVNNTRYIDWIADCFSQEDYRQRQMDWLQINYTHEVRLAERVSIGMARSKTDPCTTFVEGKNLSTGQRAFEAAVGWC